MNVSRARRAGPAHWSSATSAGGHAHRGCGGEGGTQQGPLPGPRGRKPSAFAPMAAAEQNCATARPRSATGQPQLPTSPSTPPKILSWRPWKSSPPALALSCPPQQQLSCDGPGQARAAAGVGAAAPTLGEGGGQLRAAELLASHLRLQLEDASSPLLACLAHHHGSMDMARSEVERSAALLAAIRGIYPRPARPPQGRVAVLLPDQQPLFSLVAQVLVPAMACAEVRAVTSPGQHQQVVRQLCVLLAAGLGSSVQATLDGLAQQWQERRLGAIVLHHPTDAHPSARQSLALAACPDAIIWTTTAANAQVISRAAHHCPVLMVGHVASATLLAPWRGPDERLHTAAVARQVAYSIQHQRYRPGGVPAAILVHQRLAQAFVSELASHFPANPEKLRLRMQALGPDLRLAELMEAAPAGSAVATPTLNLLRYQHDHQLGPFLASMSVAPTELVMHGESAVAHLPMPHMYRWHGASSFDVERALPGIRAASDLQHCHLFLAGQPSRSGVDLLRYLCEIEPGERMLPRMGSNTSSCSTATLTSPMQAELG